MRIFALVALASLAACSSGSGPIGTLTGTDQRDPVSAAGIWVGTLSQGVSVVNDVSCLVTRVHEIGCVLADPATGALAGGGSGSLETTSAGELSGAGVAYAAAPYQFVDGSVISEFSIADGTVAAGISLEGTVTLAGEQYTLRADYDPLSQRASSLDVVAGTYQQFAINGDMSSLSISADGEVFAQTAAGCISSGTISVIDPSLNGYRVNTTVSNCGALDGPYAGYAVSADMDATADALIFAGFNTTHGIVGVAVK